MKISIIGGGAWGSTLAQVLTDNQHKVLINEINPNYVERINNNQHPIFNLPLKNIKATIFLEPVLEYSDFIILSLPTKFMRSTLIKINQIISSPKNFINVSKGMEIDDYKTINNIVSEEIQLEKIKNYGCLMGPSHAEEVILRKLTLLVSASLDDDFAKKIQEIFFNSHYLRIYTSNDVKGVELCSAFKNVLAFISGILDSYRCSYNTKAAFISRSLVEMVRVVEFLGGKKQTVFGLAGLGDLLVTSFNENSRNYQAGKNFFLGHNVKEIVLNSNQVIEGINNLKVFYLLSLKNEIELPIVKEFYQMIFNKQSISKTINNLLIRSLKSE